MPPDDSKDAKASSVRARVHATKEDAIAQIAAIDAAMGYPRTEPGIRRGLPDSIWAESITTTSACEPVELDAGGWGVPAESLERAGLDARDAVDVAPKVRDGTAPVVKP